MHSDIFYSALYHIIKKNIGCDQISLFHKPLIGDDTQCENDGWWAIGQ